VESIAKPAETATAAWSFFVSGTTRPQSKPDPHEVKFDKRQAGCATKGKSSMAIGILTWMAGGLASKFIRPDAVTR
jgi:hypothetical protein